VARASAFVQAGEQKERSQSSLWHTWRLRIRRLPLLAWLAIRSGSAAGSTGRTTTCRTRAQSPGRQMPGAHGSYQLKR